MEHVSEREIKTEKAVKDYADILVYDQDGSRIRNPQTLRAIAEAQEFIAMLNSMIEG